MAAKKVATKKRSTPISSYKGRKGEKYMSAAMKKHFHAVLIDWREHLKEEMQKTFDHLKNKGESYADPIDRASQEEEFAFELRTRDRERKLITKIAMSLEQIKQDDYGYCYACGIEIGVKRLGKQDQQLRIALIARHLMKSKKSSSVANTCILSKCI